MTEGHIKEVDRALKRYQKYILFRLDKGRSIQYFTKLKEECYDKYKKKTTQIYGGQECKICIHQKMCTKQRKRIRYIKSFPYERERNTMNEKMNTKKGKENQTMGNGELRLRNKSKNRK